MPESKKQQFVINGHGGTGGWDSWKPKLPYEIRELIYKLTFLYAEYKQRNFVIRKTIKNATLKRCEVSLSEYRTKLVEIIKLDRQYRSYEFSDLELEKKIKVKCVILIKFAMTKFKDLQKRSKGISYKTIKRLQSSFLKLFEKTDADAMSVLKRNNKNRPLVVV